MTDKNKEKIKEILLVGIILWLVYFIVAYAISLTAHYLGASTLSMNESIIIDIRLSLITAVASIIMTELDNME